MTELKQAETQENSSLPGRDQAVVVIQGPTASGKTGLSVAIAKEFGGAIINADSLQIYDGLAILTARPTVKEMADVPHHLFGTLDPREQCSVGSWLESAVKAIEVVRAQGLIPVIAGGTGMYVRALQHGLAPVPEIPDRIRTEARARFDRLGGEVFRKELSELDPEAADRLPAGDTLRLLRAYEVVRATGKTLKHWQAEQVPRPAIQGRFATIALVPPRAVVYAAIERRFDDMMAKGALQEVEALLERDLDPELTAMKAVGVRELAAHIKGDISLQDAVESAKRSTRNYAKRQLTWLRTQSGSDAKILSEQYSESLKPKIFSFIRQFLLTSGS